ncbi:4'-phosphopantetheinyl transferase superfamily protein [Actinoallomurus spadix]|uniref:4'-phosphopantetheinyl transferase superfamily protein n=1 Tax=Actinoallomurus spadix TaxID=79912 RepID=A0ABN0W7F1_9ACTN|nr:4'-phosphopantetheinyl transferase superfamily protein [Actinoallomurus spadix]MCO5986238.1 4'-phosphopantetheinyl transferase superfamily protein [Actinoallomurus spadix]
MIEELLPPEAVGEEAYEDAPATTLFPEEEALLVRAVDKRRREFTTVRACARAAFARLGVPAAPLLPGERGAPTWPEGLVGSMTHCDGYRASAIGRSRDLLTIGIDAEPNGPLPDGVLEHVSRPEERVWLADLRTAEPGVHWDRLLFSAKESVYKAWFPLTRCWLDFEEASITVNPEAGTFTAALTVPPPQVDGRPLTGFTGRWLARKGLVLTAISVPRSPS